MYTTSPFLFGFVCIFSKKKCNKFANEEFFRFWNPLVSTKGKMHPVIHQLLQQQEVDGIIYINHRKQNYVCWEMQNRSDVLSQNFTTMQMWKHFLSGSYVMKIFLKKRVENWKIRLLSRKLGSTEHDHFSNYISLKYPQDYSFTKTVGILKQIFNECSSLFSIHFNCLNITKCNTVNFTTYAGTVNNKSLSLTERKI